MVKVEEYDDQAVKRYLIDHYADSGLANQR